MNDSPNPLQPVVLAASWMALALAHLLLETVAPRGVIGDELLPGWARVALWSTEALGLALLVLSGGAVSRAVGNLGERLPPGWRPIEVLTRILLLTGVLIALAASWGSFWLSGQFLDRQGLEFAVSNSETILGFAIRIHPILVLGGPALLLVLAAAACLALPALLRRLSDRARTWIRRVGIGALLATVVGTLEGELAHRWLKEKTTDPATGAVYSLDDLYRLRRERTAGPLTHLLCRGFGSGSPLDAGVKSDPLPTVRRRIESMERFLGRVDRGGLRRWNVIVVLVDSLRADQLLATGGRREVMPTVETLAREGRVFTDCIAQASHTDYSVPSVFSSHYPLRARDVYRYPKDPPYPRVMIYDVLKALGWRTALFSSQNDEWGQMVNYLQTGGLDVYVHAKSVGLTEKPADGRPIFSEAVDDSVTIQKAIRWIDTPPDSPFFLCLNLQSSHLPYPVPAEFPRRFGPPRIDFKISIGWFPPEKAAVVKDIYADSLVYVDGLIDRLVRHLKERGQWDHTVLVVTGDHGEAFYEHGTAAHANGVHQEVIRVPLILKAPGLTPGRDARPAELLDIAPGLFHLLGIPIHPSFQGSDLFAPDPPGNRIRYSISDTPWKTVLGILRGRFKLILDGDTGGTVLYDLGCDPEERRDATPDHPDVASDLKARLTGWRRTQLDYYENPLRQRCEYPPIVRD